MAGFVRSWKKWQDLLEAGKNGRTAFRTGAKFRFSEKNILGFGTLSIKRPCNLSEVTRTDSFKITAGI